MLAEDMMELALSCSIEKNKGPRQRLIITIFIHVDLAWREFVRIRTIREQCISAPLKLLRYGFARVDAAIERPQAVMRASLL